MASSKIIVLCMIGPAGNLELTPRSPAFFIKNHPELWEEFFNMCQLEHRKFLEGKRKEEFMKKLQGDT